MRLYVYVLEGQGLPAKEKSSYVKLQVGKSKSKTRTLGSDPVWNEEFVFRVHDLSEELIISVYQRDEDELGLFNVSGYLVGRVRIPVWSVTEEGNHCVPPTWFPLENLKSGKHITHNCGKILLTLSLHGRGDDISRSNLSTHSVGVEREEPTSVHLDHGSPQTLKSPRKKKFMKAVSNRLEKLLRKNGENTKSDGSSDMSTCPSEYEDSPTEPSNITSFEEAIDSMLSGDEQQQMPENLPGGVLVDQMYVIPSKDLNTLLFAPESQFRKDLAQLQGISDMQEGPWTWKPGEFSSLTRVVTYTKPPSKLVKAVKATEEQTYLKADGGEFAVVVGVDTPDVPCGNSFRIEILYKFFPGPELSLGEESSRLVISWGIKFHQSTMMKGMIEGGARQGLKESFEQFATLLAQDVKVLNSAESLEKDHVLATLQRDHPSDWELAVGFFGNLTVVSAIFLLLYVLAHILLCQPAAPQGLEFNGLDLPDSIGEFITSGILVILLQRVYGMVSHFIDARLQMGSDHGVKAQGDGWVVTVALIEATNLAALDPTSSSDPFVILTCNGKTRASSVQLQTCDPQWNEILEFDATEEPPSVLDVEVFDFDGPFDQASSLGHVEINFLKHTANELADLWAPLEGKLAMSLQSKLHLRVFLENKKGVETVKEYLTKMEKEVGKKLDLQSPHKNSAFQKLFGMPPEEFLIKDYLCSLRRKFILQGHLFLSARIVGFHSNFFGHRTKFFFLWEDIEDIEAAPPSLASIGSPTLVIILRKGRGADAKHGAKSQDEEGRLRFYFQSFASFDVASRTIKAIWKARVLGVDQKVQEADDQVDEQTLTVPLEGEGLLHTLDENVIKIYSTDLPVHLKLLMRIFDGGILEQKVMQKSGCLNYITTQWEAAKPDLYERHVSYKFSHCVSVFGGDVSCTQRKTPLENGKGWAVTEAMVFQGIPFSDHFHVHTRYEIQEYDDAEQGGCKCDVYLSIEWLKSNRFRARITRNVNDKFALRVKEIFELARKEILAGNCVHRVQFIDML